MRSTKRKLPSAAELLFAPTDPTVSREVDELLREQHRQRTFDNAVTLAIHDDAFRKKLAAKLKQLGEGRPKRSTSASELQQVASVIELFRLSYAGTRSKAHLLVTPRVFDEVARFLGITPSQAKKRYYLARARGLL